MLVICPEHGNKFSITMQTQAHEHSGGRLKDTLRRAAFIADVKYVLLKKIDQLLKVSRNLAYTLGNSRVLNFTFHALIFI